MVVGSTNCTCATDSNIDIRLAASMKADAVKKPTTQCGLSQTKTMIGDDANNVVALYNIEYDRQYHGTKLAPTTCKTHEHELFYTRYGIERLSLQSETGQPTLKVKCQYSHPNICQYPLLHELPASRFVSVHAIYGMP